jgi:FkbM family methyltransferase
MPWKRRLLGAANRLGSRLPRPLLRLVADFPGVLPLFERLSRGTAVAVATPEGVPLFVNPLFHANLLRGGDVTGYEPDMRAAIARLTRPGMTAFDIGANVGVFAVQFAALVGERGRVWAFEPEPNNLACLERTARDARLRHLTVDRRAVSAGAGHSPFDRRGGAFSGRLAAGDAYARTQNTIEVGTVGIDEAVERGELPPPDILKIDVEGNEGLVLRGMARTLRRHGPIVICELHGHLGDAVDAAVAPLRDAGYEIAGLQDVVAGQWRPLAGSLQELAGQHVVARRTGAP